MLIVGMLQKQHPDIALSIKTRQAIRSVLNNLRDGVHELLMDGILEEAEGTKLEKVGQRSNRRLDKRQREGQTKVKDNVSQRSTLELRSDQMLLSNYIQNLKRMSDLMQRSPRRSHWDRGQKEVQTKVNHRWDEG